MKYDLSITEQTGKSGYFLENIYKMLLAISPTFVESERVFTSSAYLCNKFRPRLSDSTLDNLCLLGMRIVITMETYRGLFTTKGGRNAVHSRFCC